MSRKISARCFTAIGALVVAVAPLALSEGGGKIVFVGGVDILAANADGTGVPRLAADRRDSTVSADGSHIESGRTTADGEDVIVAMNADETAQRRVGAAEGTFPVWSHPFPARTASRARVSASRFRAGDGGAPFDGDSRLLTTISPNGDGLRDSATFRFALDEPATATLEVAPERTPKHPVFTRTTRLPAGLNVMTWEPAAAQPGTYLVGLDLVDAAGDRRHYDARSRPGRRSEGIPVVRVLGIDAAFTRDSATPGSVATLVLATDAPSLTVQLMRSGLERFRRFATG